MLVLPGVGIESPISTIEIHMVSLAIEFYAGSCASTANVHVFMLSALVIRF
jgi:hypothetical protein